MALIDEEVRIEQPAFQEVPPRQRILETLMSKDTTVSQDEDSLENEMVLNMGPQHPATHGVLRVLLRLDGETVVSAESELGYLHRGYEKLAENMTYHEFIPHTDRLDYISPVANNVAYVMAVEKLMKIELPKRAQYTRVICCELARISSHLMALGALAMDVGALTVFVWALREREKLYDIFDVLTGVRFTVSYMRIGGMAQDIGEDSIRMINAFLEGLPDAMKDIGAMLNKNRIFLERTSGIGVMPQDEALDLGWTGPNIRAAGLPIDLRRDNPYLVYSELDFDVITRTESDVLARYWCRFYEIAESAKIVRQCLDKLPKGDYFARDVKKVLPRKGQVYSKMEDLINDFMLVNFGQAAPIGEAYNGIEAAKGELGWYLVSNGTGFPWRSKIRSPSFVNLQGLSRLLEGAMISDIVAIIGSIDPIMGEADK
ncbi:MAG: NADH dehydrogenase (quinone) subunit D [Bacteroidota bacterium]|nr:NADH dehydrogenase (quinone) subunit D [Bacteroidota bacterium]MDP4233072.1 NADH dehydrogenase (quinone) subunit D [Bacteroidota bacterium]MDP4241783.1 NADH dehydrogenase (quinone) subunit D [Bacteroidota bacterium]MDP4288796.1 NADH dehydrogenase (quinone) subunit D [Bacteroidota bacterium]